jgi:hypothetical protein
MAPEPQKELWVDPNWRDTYPSLKAYYDDNYPKEYYTFDPSEYVIDPMETMEQIEAYDQHKQLQEIKKCAMSFHYFCHKYVKIAHPKRGLLPFITFKYQRRVIDDYEKHRFAIIRKFRQGGLTTVTVLWAMWRCLFKLDETLMVVSKTDREAIAAGEIVKRGLEELPKWMQPEMSKNNDHQKIFMDTGCKLFFYTPEAARGRAITYLIVDEAAFIQQMASFWNDIFPTISTGGNVIVVSTVNGVGNWYEETYHAAERGENDFHIIDLHYDEHPEYQDPAWVEVMRAQLGEKGFQQEVLGDFLGAGSSFVPPDVLNDLDLQTRQIDPIRSLFPEWANKASRVKTGAKLEAGGLLIWREPIEGREYIMGVDAAEGVGEVGDNSCFQIIDVASCEQVAEFYSNECPNHIFAQICASVANMYNQALLIVENEKCGMTVLSKLEHDINYENLYYTDGTKAGIKTTKSSKPMFLDALRTRLLTKSMAMRSRRIVHELKHFLYDEKTKTAKPASKIYHDDGIMAMCLALYAREGLDRNLPAGYVPSAENLPEEMTEKYKAEIYDEIKRELEKGKPEDWASGFESEIWDANLDVNTDDIPIGITSKFKRPYDSLLREFGW